MNPRLRLLRIIAALTRFISVCGVGFWLGGFTFHALVVIPAGHDVLGSRTIGFITQRVTEMLNIAGVATVMLLAFNFVLEWCGRSVFQRVALGFTCTLLAATLLLQFQLHSKMSGTLEGTGRSIRDQVEFRRLHTAYEQVAMVQWFSGLIHLWFLIAVPLARGSAEYRAEDAE